MPGDPGVTERFRRKQLCFDRPDNAHLAGEDRGVGAELAGAPDRRIKVVLATGAVLETGGILAPDKHEDVKAPDATCQRYGVQDLHDPRGNERTVRSLELHRERRSLVRAAPHVVGLVAGDDVGDLLLRRLGRAEQRHVALVGQLHVQPTPAGEFRKLRRLKRQEIREQHRDRTVESCLSGRPIEDHDVLVDGVELEVEPIDVARQFIPLDQGNSWRLDGDRPLPGAVMRGIDGVQRSMPTK